MPDETIDCISAFGFGRVRAHITLAVFAQPAGKVSQAAITASTSESPMSWCNTQRAPLMVMPDPSVTLMAAP